MPRIPAKKTAAKKVVKKTSTKRSYIRKADAVELDVVAVADRTIDAGGASSNSTTETGCSQQINFGQFGTAGLLEVSIHSQVDAARGDVARKVRALIDATVACATAGATATRAVRDVLEAEQTLAIAKFELAMDGLERVIRS